MTSDSHAPRQKTRASRLAEWIALSALASALTLGADHLGWLQGLNRLVQDVVIGLTARNVDAGPVVIVAIDDKSVAALGKWPWRRSFHAELLRRLDKDAARAIGLDVLLTESDTRYPGDDAALALAIADSGKVVLPLMLQMRGAESFVVPPILPFAGGALALGHAHLAVDEDGVARSVYLRQSVGDSSWPYFSAAMAGQRSTAPQGSPQVRATEASTPGIQAVQPPSNIGKWQQSQRMLVPFAGGSGHFRRVSYVDVIDGLVPVGTFAGKYVLVGATAAGLGDLYATPAFPRSSLMPGVEFSANVLDALLTGNVVTEAPTWTNRLLAILSIVLALVIFSRLGALAALLMTLAALALMPALAALAIVAFGLQLAPAGAMLGLGLSYGLWSWRRLSEATRYLMDESHNLTQIGGFANAATIGRKSGDFLGNRIAALRGAADQLANVHRFVSDSLDAVPDPTLVCDRSGRVSLANAAALTRLKVASRHALHGQEARVLLSDVYPLGDAIVASPATLSGPPISSTIPARDKAGRDVLIKQSPAFAADGGHTGWIIALVDVTTILDAQRQREDAMRFLSHDMRSPLASILTLQALQRQDPTAMSAQDFHDRVERHATKALNLADDFTHLVRAQSSDYLLETHDLGDVLLECVDDAWEATRRYHVEIELVACVDRAEADVVRPLLVRAVSNLLGNAMKFSPAGSVVACGIERAGTDWAIFVRDEGPGIAEDIRASLFQPFVRGVNRNEGAGLGLAFVDIVAKRHGGRVVLDPPRAAGSVFRIFLPGASKAVRDLTQIE